MYLFDLKHLWKTNSLDLSKSFRVIMALSSPIKKYKLCLPLLGCFIVSPALIHRHKMVGLNGNTYMFLSLVCPCCITPMSLLAIGLRLSVLLSTLLTGFPFRCFLARFHLLFCLRQFLLLLIFILLDAECFRACDPT